MKRSPLRYRYRNTGPSPEVVEAVYERAGWSCEITGSMVGPRRGVDHHIHHRRPRGAGGTQRDDTNQPQNLMLLSPGAHDTVESRRSEALAMGWLVSQYDDPATVPVLIRGDCWKYLDPTGTYSDDPPGGTE